jgi:drug/metabolite transporter (DMT)-like permease
MVALAPRPAFESVPALAWGGFAYVSAISMYGAFVPWYAGLVRAGIARGSQVQLTQPFLSLLWSALLLGEELEPRVWLAATAVVGSIAIATRARMGFASRVGGISARRGQRLPT